MPELPEVETLKLSLEPFIINSTITEVELKRFSLRYPLDVNLRTDIVNNKILQVKRRAKYLILELASSKSLIIHLGMSGRFTLQQMDYQPKKHDHVIFHLNSGKYLVFNDARRFGMVEAVLTSKLETHRFFKNLSVEPLAEEFNAHYLQEKLRLKKAPIKNTLMDNNVVVGIGNIYASESLFLAKINPLRMSNSLHLQEISKLVIAAKKVLTKAIDSGGTTLRDFVGGDNKPGYFKQELSVYARHNKNCLVCSDKILKIKQAGRATFYCSKCQN